jgi:MFS family permease
VPGTAPPLRHNRDFMLLWVSQIVSTVGTRITAVAYPLLTLALTHSPAKAGIVGFAQTLPFLLLYLPAGVVMDRWNRKLVMIFCEGGRALALGSIAVTTALGSVSLVQLIIVAFIEGCLFVLFDLGEGAALPHLVAQDQLPAAIAQNQAKTQGADLAGQPLGGVLFSVARQLPFLVDAVSYLISLGALLFIRSPFQQPTTHPPVRLRAEIAEGLRWVWTHPFLRAAVALTGGLNFVFNGLTLVLIVRAKDLGASSALIGAMFAFYGVGGLIGSFAAPWVQRRFAPRRVIVTIAWFWVVQTAVLVLLPNVYALGLDAGLGALAGAPFNVVLANHVYLITPDRLLGRVRSATKLVAWGSIPVGVLAGGFLASALGARPTLIVLAAGMLVVAAGTTFAPGLRELPQVVAEAPM